jgi:hypothetical protein
VGGILDRKPWFGNTAAESSGAWSHKFGNTCGMNRDVSYRATRCMVYWSTAMA